MRYSAYLNVSPAGDSFAVVIRAWPGNPAPRVPEGTRVLGHGVFETRKEAIDEAIRYLTAERTVAEADAITKRG